MEGVTFLVELISHRNPSIRDVISKVLGAHIIDDIKGPKNLYFFDILVLFEQIESLSLLYSSKKLNVNNASKYVSRNYDLTNSLINYLVEQYKFHTSNEIVFKLSSKIVEIVFVKM
jgi:hypothetical protein